MDVSFDRVALEKSATTFTTTGETFGGHATTVANLVGLRSAFGVLGEQVWQSFQDQLDSIRQQLEAARGDTTHAGTTLGTTGRGATTIDLDHGNAVRSAGDISGR